MKVLLETAAQDQETGKPAQSVSLRQFPITVGRHEKCGLRITAPSVSRWHCELIEENGWLHVNDLSSSNGTLINGEKIVGRSVIVPGDVLEIGPAKMIVRYDAPESIHEQKTKVTVLSSRVF